MNNKYLIVKQWIIMKRIIMIKFTQILFHSKFNKSSLMRIKLNNNLLWCKIIQKIIKNTIINSFIMKNLKVN